MRKASLVGVDLNERLSLLDDVNLYPVTSPQQTAEFEQLANSLIALHTGSTGLVVVFAATVKGEGNSYVSYNVARHLSLLLDRKVAWIDANFRSPQERLQNEEVNFRALLRDPSLFDQLKRGSNFVLVGNGDLPVKSTNLLKSNNYLELIARLLAFRIGSMSRSWMHLRFWNRSMLPTWLRRLLAWSSWSRADA
jgi:hypothetical protein